MELSKLIVAVFIIVCSSGGICLFVLRIIKFWHERKKAKEAKKRQHREPTYRYIVRGAPIKYDPDFFEQMKSEDLEYAGQQN